MRKKRLISLLLSTVMILSLIIPVPSVVGADEPPASVNETKGPLERPSSGTTRDQVLAHYSDGAYGDTALSFEERAADLISRMTHEEKRAQLLAFWNSLDSTMAGAVPTLGILGNRWWKEALHGIGREGHATSFPAPLNMASMWNPDLMLKMAVAISDEGRYHSNIGWNARQGNSLTYWSPTINLHRDPRWGRNEESMGEDPFLAGMNASMFVSGMQGDERTAGIDPNYNDRYLKASSTVKHFAANNSEVNRNGGETKINDRTLREYYLNVFQNVVENTSVESTMTAYNKVNGVPNAANTYLVDDLLRKTWGFGGHVVSDCGAVNDIVVGSNGTWSMVTGGNAGQKSTARAIRAGTDTNCSFENQQIYLRNALSAIELGYMTEDDLDLALLRLFTERMRTGEFDPPELNSYREIGRTGSNGYATNQYVGQSSFNLLESDANLLLSRQASVESLTLLKNDVPDHADYNSDALPVDLNTVPDNGSIVLVGDFANYLELGDYSRDLPTQLINNNDSNELRHIDTVARGLERYIQNYNAKTGKNITFKQFQGNPAPKGRDGWMRNTRNFRFHYGDGKQTLTVNSSTAANVIGGCQKEGNNLGYVTDGSFAAYTSLDIENLTGITLETSGDSSTPRTVYIHFRVGSYSGPVLATITSTRNSGDGWGNYRYFPTTQTTNVNTTVLANAIEEFGSAPGIYLVVSSNSNPNVVEDVESFADDFEDAKAAAAAADLAIVVVGSGQRAANLPGGYKLCGEGGDRENLALSLKQDDLAYEISKVAKRSVVYMQSVGFHIVDKFIDETDAFIFSSYNGQHQGWAFPQVIFGEQNPSSRLAFTWYKNESEIPGILDYSLRAQSNDAGGYSNYGRTYQHFTGDVQWPFGFGLSYSNYEITNIKLDKNSADIKDKVTVTFDVENKSNRPGAQTVQVFMTSPKAYNGGVRNDDYPVKQLKGFSHVQLDANEKKLGVAVEMDVNDFFFIDTPDSSGFDNEFGRPVNPGKRVVYSGNYAIEVGTSSADIVQTLNLDVTGSVQLNGQAQFGFRPWLKNAVLRGTKVWTHPGTTIQSNLSVALSDEKLFDTDLRQHTSHVVGVQPAPRAISDLISEIAAYSNETYNTDAYPVTVTFSSSNPEVATVNGATGEVTAVTYGAATITAKVVADNGESFETSYPLVVNDIIAQEEPPEPPTPPTPPTPQEGAVMLKNDPAASGMGGNLPFVGGVRGTDYFSNNGSIGVEDGTSGRVGNTGNGTWIRWSNVDLKEGIKSWKLFYAQDANGATSTVSVRVSAPGAGFSEAKSVGTLTWSSHMGNWGSQGNWDNEGFWVRYPNPKTAASAFLSESRVSYDAPPPEEDPSWENIQDPEFTGVCDVYFSWDSSNLNFYQLYLMLNEPEKEEEDENSEKLPNPQGNLMIRVTPQAAREEFEVLLYDLQSGAKLTTKTDGMSVDVQPGTYGYIVRSAGYANQMGTVEAGSEHTAAKPQIITIKMVGGASVPLVLIPTASDKTVTGTWGSGPEIAQEYRNGNSDPIILEGYGFTGWAVSPAWIKFPNVNLMGGIESYTLRYGKDGSNDTMGFNVHVAPANSASPSSTAVSYPVIGEPLSFRQGSGWSTGINVSQNTINEVGQEAKGENDIYARFTQGGYNLATLTLNLKSLGEIAVNTYNVTFSVRPYDAELSVTKLDGTTVYAGSASKTVALEEGFYRYTVSVPGYVSKQQMLLVVDSSRRIMTVLDSAVNASVRYEAESASRTGGSIVDGSYSNDQAISGFTNVDFTVPKTVTGITKVDIRYAGANSGNITITPNGEGAKAVPLYNTGISSVYVDLRGADNILRVSGVPSGFILDCIDVYSGTTAGSVDSDDVQRIPPQNPVVRSMFTADPEAKVWPNEPDKVYIYPSHDRWPTQGGCGRMDQYHVFSSINMIDWVDEGEILRYDDLTQSSKDPATPYWNQLERTTATTDISQSTLMWAPDAVYKDGWYYFYWPVPLKIGVAYPSLGVSAGNSWGISWVTGVRRSRYPDRDFEEIPESDAYPGFPGYIEGLVGTDIDIAVRVFEDPQTGKQVPYFYIGGGQHYWQGILEDNMCEVKSIELVSCANGTSCNTKGCLADPTDWYTPTNTSWYTPSDYIKNKREALGQTALGWTKTVKNINHAIPYYHEGPSIFRKAPDDIDDPAFKNGPLADDYNKSTDGYVYYLIYPSSNSAGYPEVSPGGGDLFRYCTGPTPIGPWTPRGVFFDKVSTQSTSHGSIFEFKDKWYMTYHTADLYGGTGEVRSIAVDEVTFNPDGTIQFFRATADGVEQNGPAYQRPAGTIYSVADAEPIGTGWSKYEDPLNATNPQGGTTIITNMNANGRGIRFNNVDGGEERPYGPAGVGNRARIFFHYSTTDHLPKMELIVNGKSYSLINFTRTGGNSFFADIDFTVGTLKPGPNNTIELRIQTGITGDNNSLNANNIGGKINLNYIEVVLFDDATETEDPLPPYVITSVNTIQNITSGYDAIVPVTVTGENLEGIQLTAELFGVEADVVNGQAMIRLKAVDVPVVEANALFPINVYADGVKVAETTITVMAMNRNIWEVEVLDGGDDTVKIRFFEPFTGTAGFGVKVNNQTVAIQTQSETEIGINREYKVGDTYVISGVKFPVRFPSYSFTFTATAA